MLLNLARSTAGDEHGHAAWIGKTCHDTVQNIVSQLEARNLGSMSMNYPVRTPADDAINGFLRQVQIVMNKDKLKAHIERS